MTNLERLLILHEGIKLREYLCPAGKLTIGVGHNREARPLPEDGKEVSLSRALEILQTDVGDVAAEMVRLKMGWVGTLDEVRQAVLTDMAFNMGVGGLAKFEKTLGHVQRGAFGLAANEMLKSRWAAQVCNRAQRLALMMRSGKWPPGLEQMAQREIDAAERTA